MPKKIIFCADGTWNGPEDQTGVSAVEAADDRGELKGGKVTNVVKLFANLAGRVTPETLTLHDEQEKIVLDGTTVLQVAKYVHGVGDSSNVLRKALGGVFGMGVIARVVRGYTFISRNYVDGDEIHITGFSRGAYTARALAGMICKVGLLDPSKYDANDKGDAYRLGVAAWCKAKGVSLAGSSKLTNVASAVLNFVQSIFARHLSDDMLRPNIKIKSVAVWDTVGAMGIPVYAADTRYDVFRFTDGALSTLVENGFHAMAIDEMRCDFPVTRWDSRPGVTEVWFCGAHADVGGGYPANESRLSDSTLKWMIAKLAGVGVIFATPPTYAPVVEPIDVPIHTPWTEAPFNVLQKSCRNVGAQDTIHASVLARWSGGIYRPKALSAYVQSGLSVLHQDTV
jgi:glutathione S-transferase